MNDGLSREIPKEVEPPELCDEAVDLLTALCFGQSQNLGPAEAILVFGTSHPATQALCADHVLDVLRRVPNAKLFLTGGVLPDANTSRAESVAMLVLLKRKGLPDHVKVCFETTSWDTRENVVEALKLGLANYPRIVTVGKWSACGRQRLTLQKLLPNAEIWQRGVTASEQGRSIILSPDFWHWTDIGRAKVWAEFLCIEKYGSRGDIAYPQDVEDKVRFIRFFESVS